MFKYGNILVTTVASGIALSSEIKGKQLAATVALKVHCAKQNMLTS